MIQGKKRSMINTEGLRLFEKGEGYMASTKEYLQFVLEQLSEGEEISYRPMMGEYILYCQGKVIGGIYDNRLLVKPTSSAQTLLPDVIREIPYAGGKEMLLVETIENGMFLRQLFMAIAVEVPAPRKKK